jgi:hypothetical protein
LGEWGTNFVVLFDVGHPQEVHILHIRSLGPTVANVSIVRYTPDQSSTTPELTLVLIKPGDEAVVASPPVVDDNAPGPPQADVQATVETFRISADVPIAVRAVVMHGENFAQFQIFPVHDLGMKYHVVADHSGVLGIAAPNDTVVNVTITLSDSAKAAYVGHVSDMHVKNISVANPLILRSEGDFTGTTIVASGPIAVFTKAATATTPASIWTQQHATAQWGTEFVVPNFNTSATTYDGRAHRMYSTRVVRIMTRFAKTIVNFAKSAPFEVSKSGSWVERAFPAGEKNGVYIKADKPVQVALITRLPPSRSRMTMITPTERFSPFSAVAPFFEHDYVTVLTDRKWKGLFKEQFPESHMNESYVDGTDFVLFTLFGARKEPGQYMSPGEDTSYNTFPVAAYVFQLNKTDSVMHVTNAVAMVNILYCRSYVYIFVSCLDL